MKILLYPALFFLSIAGGFVAAKTAQSAQTQTPTTFFEVLETSYMSGGTPQAQQPLAGAGCGV